MWLPFRRRDLLSGVGRVAYAPCTNVLGERYDLAICATADRRSGCFGPPLELVISKIVGDGVRHITGRRGDLITPTWGTPRVGALT